MVREGLGPTWKCVFANDLDEKKAASYRANWGPKEFWLGNVTDVNLDQLPHRVDLAWASFPCQDLSLAGSGAGLAGERSGTFWPFWNHIKNLKKQGRAPTTIVLENVYGAITSHDGQDFVSIVSALSEESYRCGAVVINANLFLPQSRPRLFIVGVQENRYIRAAQYSKKPSALWHPQALQRAYDRLPEHAKNQWVWWNLPQPSPRPLDLINVIEDEPSTVSWHTNEQTKALLGMMSSTNLAKIKTAKRRKKRMVGTIYKRTRADGLNGAKVQRAEVRFDHVAGCLRTPGGGSSRQIIIVVDGEVVKSRLISPREAARLMGLPDDYILPTKYNEAYHLAGDGVAVPVVHFLAKTVLEPILLNSSNQPFLLSKSQSCDKISVSV